MNKVLSSFRRNNYNKISCVPSLRLALTLITRPS